MNFLYGTYGFDLLSMFLMVLSLILSFGRYTSLLGFVLLIIILFRAFSKDIYKRTAEQNKFVSLVNKILNKFGKSLPYNLPRGSLDVIPMMFSNIKRNFQQRKGFKIVKCPKCHQKLRLPKGQGKIIVTCKRCNNEFKLKT